MTAKDWFTVAGIVASLAISLFTLYRAELRGPSVKFKWLRAPSKWDANGGFFSDEYKSDGQGGRIAINRKWRVQASGHFEAIIENFGPRTGVLYETTLNVQNIPKPFNLFISGYDATPVTIAGKTTIALVISITLDIVTKDAAEALAAFKGLGDLVASADYRASRSLGRMLKDHDEISAPRQPILEAVEAWGKKLAPTPTIDERIL